MADVIYTPSIWDYLGQGIQKGAEAYNKRKADDKDTEDKKMSFMTQLLNAGLINQDDFNKAADNTRFKDINVRKSKDERQENLAKFGAISEAPGTAPTGMPSTGKAPAGRTPTANEFKAVGLLTPGEQAQDQALGAKSTTETNVEGVKQRYAAGEPISQREAAAANLQTDDMLNEARSAQSHKLLVAQGPQFVDQALAPIMQENAGRIPTRGWEQVADQAAEEYNKQRIASNLPADPSARAFMYSAILERLIAQRKDDIEQTKANNVGMNRLSPVDRMFQAMTGVVETRRKVLDDMQNNNMLLSIKLNNPNASNDPDVIRYRSVEQQLQNAQNAQAMLAQGIIPDSAKRLLGVDPTIAPNATGQQIVGPGAPGAQVRQDVVKSLVEKIQKNPALQSQLAGGLKAGTITQAEYDAITQQVTGAASAPPQPKQQVDTTRRMGPR